MSVTRDQIVRTIVHMYLQTGEPVTAKAAAERIGVSPQKITGALASYPGGLPPYFRCDKVSRPRMSRDYPMMEAGVTTSNGYSPSKELLRLMILAVTDIAVLKSPSTAPVDEQWERMQEVLLQVVH